MKIFLQSLSSSAETGCKPSSTCSVYAGAGHSICIAMPMQSVGKRNVTWCVTRAAQRKSSNGVATVHGVSVTMMPTL